ncbi:unnamed protein product [Dicrocoelium dendriticum]|nr:unnamed protein product [Dicrocoelium dendriticum]
MDVLCCTASILHLVAIAIDRYWAVTRLQYLRSRNERPIICMIAVVWITSLAISLPTRFHSSRNMYDVLVKGQCRINEEYGFTIFSTLGAFYFPMGFLIAAYAKIYQAARARIRKRQFRKPHELTLKAGEEACVTNWVLSESTVLSTNPVDCARCFQTCPAESPKRTVRSSTNARSAMCISTEQETSATGNEDVLLDSSFSPFSADTRHSDGFPKAWKETDQCSHNSTGESESSDTILNCTSYKNELRCFRVNDDNASSISTINESNSSSKSVSPSSQCGVHLCVSCSNALYNVHASTPDAVNTRMSLNRGMKENLREKDLFRRSIRTSTCPQPTRESVVEKTNHVHRKFLSSTSLMIYSNTNASELAPRYAVYSIPSPFLTESDSGRLNVWSKSSLDSDTPVIVDHLDLVTANTQIKSLPESPYLPSGTSSLSAQSSGCSICLSNMSASNHHQTLQSNGSLTFPGSVDLPKLKIMPNHTTPQQGKSDFSRDTKLIEQEHLTTLKLNVTNTATVLSNNNVSHGGVFHHTGNTYGKQMSPKSETHAMISRFFERRMAHAKLLTRRNTVQEMEDSKERMENRRERKAVRTLAIITGCFILCWLPFFVKALAVPFCAPVCSVPSVVESLFLWLGYLNSLLNPVLYTVFSPEFRMAFKKIICRLVGHRFVR